MNVKRRIALRIFSFALAAICNIPSSASASLIITSFGAGAFSTDTNAMNSTLGITGYTIEDFEDTTLISGLSYTLTSPSSGTFTALPNTAAISSNYTFTNNQWDGTHVLMNNSTNSLDPEGTRTGAITFDLLGAVDGFGVGFGNFQSQSSPLDQFPITDHELLINGVSFGLLESLLGWTGGRTTRNGYVLITATGGDLISSVSFRNLIQGAAGDEDLMVFDHLAVHTSAVPEPLTLSLVSLGALGGLGLRRKKGAAC